MDLPSPKSSSSSSSALTYKVPNLAASPLSSSSLSISTSWLHRPKPIRIADIVTASSQSPPPPQQRLSQEIATLTTTWNNSPAFHPFREYGTMDDKADAVVDGNSSTYNDGGAVRYSCYASSPRSMNPHDDDDMMLHLRGNNDDERWNVSTERLVSMMPTMMFVTRPKNPSPSSSWVEENCQHHHDDGGDEWDPLVASTDWDVIPPSMSHHDVTSGGRYSEPLRASTQSDDDDDRRSHSTSPIIVASGSFLPPHQRQFFQRGGSMSPPPLSPYSGTHHIPVATPTVWPLVPSLSSSSWPTKQTTNQNAMYQATTNMTSSTTKNVTVLTTTVDDDRMQLTNTNDILWKPIPKRPSELADLFLRVRDSEDQVVVEVPNESLTSLRRDRDDTINRTGSYENVLYRQNQYDDDDRLTVSSSLLYDNNRRKDPVTEFWIHRRDNHGDHEDAKIAVPSSLYLSSSTPTYVFGANPPVPPVMTVAPTDMIRDRLPSKLALTPASHIKQQQEPQQQPPQQQQQRLHISETQKEVPTIIRPVPIRAIFREEEHTKPPNKHQQQQPSWYTKQSHDDSRRPDE